MTLGTIAIVLVAALAHAIWNTVSKYKRGDTFLFVWAYTCAATLLCLPLSIALLAAGADAFSWQLALASIVSAALHVVYSLTLQAGYDRFELGVVYPVARGTGPVLTLLVAVLLLGERPGAVAILGAVVVVAGIVVVAGNPFRGGGQPLPGGDPRRLGDVRHPLRGVAWGAVTGCAIAGYTLWDSFSVTELHLSPVTYFTGTFLVQSLVLTPFALRRRTSIAGTFRADAGPILTVAVLSPLAYILVLTALQTAPVALVAPLRESSIVIGSLLAWRLFHEGDLARRLIGAGIVLAGISAISL